MDAMLYDQTDREVVCPHHFESKSDPREGIGETNGSSNHWVARFFMPGGSMIDSRPNPIQAAQQLRNLAREWRNIEAAIIGNSAGDGTSTTGFRSTVPAATLMSLSQEIDAFATFHAKCLADETDWNPLSRATDGLIAGLAGRIGHFTNGDDARLAWDFYDELESLYERAHKATRPDGRAWMDVGHGCTVQDCAGRMRVLINRDNGHTPGWRPMAHCFTVDNNGNEHTNREHAVDALLLAATADMVAA